MLRKKIENKEKMTGTHICLTDTTATKIVAMAGYDYIFIDLEHTYKPLENLLADIMIIKATGTIVIVRVPQNDLTFTKQVLEMGPDGIIFPMVHSAKEAEEARKQAQPVKNTEETAAAVQPDKENQNG